MTKKDYELIASVIKMNYDAWSISTVKDLGQVLAGKNAIIAITDDLADTLQDENPLFDRVKFLKACGVKND